MNRDLQALVDQLRRNPQLAQNFWFTAFKKERYPGTVPNPVGYARHLAPTLRLWEAMRADEAFREGVIEDFLAWLPKHRRTLKAAAIGETITEDTQVRRGMFVRGISGVIARVRKVTAGPHHLDAEVEIRDPQHGVVHIVGPGMWGLVRVEKPEEW